MILFMLDKFQYKISSLLVVMHMKSGNINIIRKKLVKKVEKFILFKKGD